MDMELLKSKVDLFIENSNDKYGRYKSWHHCYEYFQNKDNRKLDNVEMLSIHLSMYLASWGMYRGSSFLLQHDYMYNEKAVKVLLDDKYKKMWYIDWWKLDDKSKENIKDILFGEKGLIEELEGCYKDKESDSAFDGDNIATETLITKILLGTMGCVPAYDRFLKDGIGYLKNDKKIDKFKEITKTLTSSSRSKTSYSKLLDIISSDDFKKTFKDEKYKDYPPMKIMDMFLWETGFDFGVNNYIDNNKSKKRYKKKIEQYKKYFKEEFCQDDLQKEIYGELTKVLNE